MAYIRAELHTLLTAAFDSDSLRTFCFKYFPDVEKEFAAGQTQSPRVEMLIRYAEQRNRVDHLHALIARERPEKYAEYADRLGIAPNSAPTFVPLNLPPVSRQHIIPREAEIARILDAVQRRQLILLHGLGGIGKTTLAVDIAQRLAEELEYVGAILWVGELSGADTEAICDNIARQLGELGITQLTGQAKYEATKALLASLVRVLILDDVSATKTLGPFRRHCLPQTTVLIVTSRNRQLIAGMTAPIEVPRLEPAQAIALFRGQAGPDEKSSDDAVGEVCTTLGNHPLAITIAASRRHIEGLSLAELSSELATAKARVGLNLGPDKDENVEASLLLSFQDMPEEEQHVIIHLAACFGETTGMELLADICGMSRPECSGIVGKLVMRSLVERGQERVGLHQLVRDFVCEAMGGETLIEVRDRVLVTVVGYAQHYAGEPEAFDLLAAELSNVTGAQEYATTRERWAETLKLGRALLGTSMLYFSGYWREWVALGKAGIEAAGRIEDTSAQAFLLHNTGIGVQGLGEKEEAARLYHESLELSRQLGWQAGIASTLHNLGMLAQERGEVAEAERLYHESLAIARQVGDQAGIAISLHQLGRLAHDRGEVAEAERLYHESLAIFERLGSPNAEIARRNLSRLAAQVATVSANDTTDAPRKRRKRTSPKKNS